MSSARSKVVSERVQRSAEVSRRIVGRHPVEDVGLSQRFRW
jgi:hypothetical protein